MVRPHKVTALGKRQQERKEAADLLSEQSDSQNLLMSLYTRSPLHKQQQQYVSMKRTHPFPDRLGQTKLSKLYKFFPILFFYRLNCYCKKIQTISEFFFPFRVFAWESA